MRQTDTHKLIHAEALAAACRAQMTLAHITRVRMTSSPITRSVQLQVLPRKLAPKKVRLNPVEHVVFVFGVCSICYLFKAEFRERKK
jgi:hypothetical protein